MFFYDSCDSVDALTSNATDSYHGPCGLETCLLSYDRKRDSIRYFGGLHGHVNDTMAKKK